MVAPIPISYDDFIRIIKNNDEEDKRIDELIADYTLGDCGFQYGKVWRDWEKYEGQYFGKRDYFTQIDQIANVINSLKSSPEGRRHIVTAIDPAHQDDLALYWCHALFQFNCRPLNIMERMSLCEVNDPNPITGGTVTSIDPDIQGVPKYYLDCQLYQRSADAVLGVPFNIASYALLTHIIAKIVNMVPGEFIHTFGDVHIYDNHWAAVEEQLSREPRELPTLKFSELMQWDKATDDLTGFFDACGEWEFDLEGYNPHPAIKAELSTGLIK
jgi:thymidylate synthase